MFQVANRSCLGSLGVFIFVGPTIEMRHFSYSTQCISNHSPQKSIAHRLGAPGRVVAMNQLIELDIIVRALIRRLVQLHGAANLTDYLEHLARQLRRQN